MRVTAEDDSGNTETSKSYRILEETEAGILENEERQRLFCRGMLCGLERTPEDALITRGQLAEMMGPLAQSVPTALVTLEKDAMAAAIRNGFLAPDAEKGAWPEGYVTRQEMATVAMQACGVNYRNASSTMPDCADVCQVSNNYGTNVARALYFGFMELDPDGCFAPRRFVTVGEAVWVLNRVADFAGI